MDRSDARKRKAELAGDAANETPEASFSRINGHVVDYINHRFECTRCHARLLSLMQFQTRECPAPVQPPAPDPDEQTGWHRHQTQGVVRDSDCRCSHGIRNVPAPDPDETTPRRLRCTQCGKGYEERACGPTHALIAHERANTTPTPAPPATTGPADEAEGLARLLFEASGWHPTQWDDESSAEFLGRRASLILASDWLAARDAAQQRIRAEKAERRTARDAVAAKERAEDSLTVLRNGVQLIVAELEAVIPTLMEEGDSRDATIAGTHKRVADQLRDVLHVSTDRADRIAREGQA